MATQPPSLADDLKSLRIDRAPANRGLPGWVTPAIEHRSYLALWRSLASG